LAIVFRIAFKLCLHQINHVGAKRLARTGEVPLLFRQRLSYCVQIMFAPITHVNAEGDTPHGSGR
jgi:hypothetical protein